MSLHHQNGDRLIEPNEWILEQLHLMRQWNVAHWEPFLSEDQVVHLWITLFAQWARDICDRHVDIETFDQRFLEFENRLLPALMVYAWQMREALGRHVPLEVVVPHVRGSLMMGTVYEGRNIVRFSMNVPCDDGNGGHTEIVEFPVNGVLAKTFHSQ